MPILLKTITHGIATRPQIAKINVTFFMGKRSILDDYIALYLTVLHSTNSVMTSGLKETDRYDYNIDIEIVLTVR